MKFKHIGVYTRDGFAFDLDRLKEFGTRVSEYSTPSEFDSDVDCLIIDWATTVRKEEIDLLKGLKYIGICGTAFGRVDVSYAKSNGIIVTNLPGYSTAAVAEYVVGVVLEHFRGFGDVKDNVTIEKRMGLSYSGGEIYKKKVGIVGLGQIGKHVADIFLGFGAEVVYWSRNRKKDYEARGVSYVSFEELVDVDVLAITVAQTPETTSIVSKDFLSAMTKGSVVVNISPNEIVDINGIVKNKHVHFIGEFTPEYRVEEFERLRDLDHVSLYPLITHRTVESKDRMEALFFGNISGYLVGRTENDVSLF